MEDRTLPRTIPLLAVILLFRSKPEFEAFSHVVDTVSTFVDSSVELPFAKACKFGSLKLLNRIRTSTVATTRTTWSIRSLIETEAHYRHYQFTFSLLEAVKLKNLEMVQWLCDYFLGYGVRNKVIEEAAAVGAMDILEYFDELDLRIYTDVDEEGEYYTDDDPILRQIIWGGRDAAKAIRGGFKDVATWLYEIPQGAYREDHETLKAAIASGDIELVEWLQKKHDVNVDVEFQEAAANGHLDTVKWMYKQAFEDGEDRDMWFDRGVLVAAAQCGQLEVVRWLIEHDKIVGSYHNDSDLESDDGNSGYGSDGGYKSKHCRRNLLRRPHTTNVGGEATVAMHVAARNGHLEVAKYLYSCVAKPNKKSQSREMERLDRTIGSLWDQYEREFISQDLSEETMYITARKGLFDVVKWVYEMFGSNLKLNLFGVYDYKKRKECYAIDIAATNGHLEIVQYLHQVGKQTAINFVQWRQRKQAKHEHKVQTDPFYAKVYGNDKPEMPTKPQCTTEAMDGAAANGHLEIVQWFNENRDEGCTTLAMELAAEHGHLGIVQYLHENFEGGWSEETMDCAATSGHFHVVKWLHEHLNEGCTTAAMDGAASNGHLNVVKWLHENRAEGCTKAAMDEAASGGHLEVVVWLHQNRSEGGTTAAMDGAATNGFLNIVKWLHRNRSEGCTTAAMDKAAGNGHLRVVRWLHENRTEGCTTDAMDNAVFANEFEVVLLLHRMRNEGCVKKPSTTTTQLIKDWVAENYPEI